VSETEALFGVLRQSADAGCAAAIEGAVANAPDHELCRVNALAFAAKNNWTKNELSLRSCMLRGSAFLNCHGT
jgi:Family of unknown function (DUF5939)